MRALGILLVGVAVGAAGCDKTPPPTSPSGTFASGPVQIETFTGTLTPFGVRFYSFTVSNPGTIYLTLISLRAGGASLDAQVTLSIGVPAATDCATEFTTQAPPRTSPQLSGFVVPGVYCARIADVGSLTQATEFTMNIAYPR
jgi:hypothetical protein